LFDTSKLLYISDITKRIGNFFKLPIQLFQSPSYPELTLIINCHIDYTLISFIVTSFRREPGAGSVKES